MNLRKRKRLGKVGIAGLTAAVAAGLTVTVAVIPSNAAPAVSTASYIVVLDRDAGTGIQARSASVAQRFDSTVEHTYTAALHGFSLRLTEKQAGELAAEGGVADVVPDTPVHALGQQTDPPSWGLDRIDQHALPLDGVYNYLNEAENVTAYVIDTGISATHQASVSRPRPSEIIRPQVGVGGGMPAPRKDSVASAMITTPMLSVTSTMKVLSTLGRMWVSMMRSGEQPRTSASATKSRCLSASTSPRMMRAKLAHSSRPIAVTSVPMP